MCLSTAYLAQNDTDYLGHGTTYASPGNLLVGAACLGKHFREYSAPEIMQMRRKLRAQFNGSLKH
jgi:hypothetical protein